MQQDFHFNVAYALCRCAGFRPQDSQTIASASQYTDDCVLVRQLPRPDGSVCAPIQTQCPGQMAFAERWQKGILFPFHFLCESESYPFTVPGNPRTTNLLTAAVALLSDGTPFAYHALGIALHSFADTFAHQGFSAFDDARNAVSGLDLIPKDDAKLEQITGRFIHDFPKLPPKIGHAQAVYCPDIPFLRWKYRGVKDTRWVAQATPSGVAFFGGNVERDNAIIAADAARQIAGMLASSSGDKPNVSASEQADFFDAARFRAMDTLGRREDQWRETFMKDGFFAGFREADDDACCRYQGKDWLGKAYGFVFPSGGGPAIPSLKEEYQTTDWWKFQLAAKWVKTTLC
jgi:hypothetical protein